MEDKFTIPANEEGLIVNSCNCVVIGADRNKLNKYDSYIDKIRPFFVSTLEGRIYALLEKFVYSEEADRFWEQFPCLEKCIDTTSSGHYKKNMGTEIVVDAIKGTIKYLIKEGIFTAFINSVVLNNRINRICRELDALGVEKTCLGYLNVWNFVCEKDYWLDNPIRSQVEDPLSDLMVEVGTQESESSKVIKRKASNSDSDFGKDSDCKIRQTSLEPTICRKRRYLKICVFKDFWCGKRKKGRVKLPCKSGDLMKILKVDCLSMRKKFEERISNFCSCLNDVLGRVDGRTIRDLCLLCKIRSGYVSFKLKSVGSSSIFSSRVVTCKCPNVKKSINKRETVPSSEQEENGKSKSDSPSEMKETQQTNNEMMVEICEFSEEKLIEKTNKTCSTQTIIKIESSVEIPKPAIRNIEDTTNQYYNHNSDVSQTTYIVVTDSEEAIEQSESNCHCTQQLATIVNNCDHPKETKNTEKLNNCRTVSVQTFEQKVSKGINIDIKETKETFSRGTNICQQETKTKEVNTELISEGSIISLQTNVTKIISVVDITIFEDFESNLETISKEKNPKFHLRSNIYPGKGHSRVKVTQRSKGNGDCWACSGTKRMQNIFNAICDPFSNKSINRIKYLIQTKLWKLMFDRDGKGSKSFVSNERFYISVSSEKTCCSSGKVFSSQSEDSLSLKMKMSPTKIRKKKFRQSSKEDFRKWENQSTDSFTPGEAMTFCHLGKRNNKVFKERNCRRICLENNKENYGKSRSNDESFCDLDQNVRSKLREYLNLCKDAKYFIMKDSGNVYGVSSTSIPFSDNERGHLRRP